MGGRAAGYRRDVRGGHPRQHAHVLDLGGELRAGGAQAAPTDLRRGGVEQEGPARVCARTRAGVAPRVADGGQGGGGPAEGRGRGVPRAPPARGSGGDRRRGAGRRIRRDPAAVVWQEVAGRDERNRPMTLKVLDPRLSAEGDAARLAAPLAGLDGALVGLLDNAKIGTTRFYDHLETMLRERY